MQESGPLVSVLIPTFRRPKELRRVLESVGGQTYMNLQIIVSNNDCKNEESNVLCRDFAAKDTRVVYHEQSVNIGGWENNELLIRAATGEYTLAMNDDDWISDNFIEATLKVLQNDPQCTMVNGDYVLHNAKDEAYSTISMDEKTQNSPADRVVAAFNSRIRIAPFHGLCRTGLFVSTLPDGKPRYGEDWIMTGKMAFLGKIRNASGATYHKRCANDIAFYADFFDAPDIADSGNDFEAIFLSMMDSVMHDSFYADRLERRERARLAALISAHMGPKAMLGVEYVKGIKDCLRYLWRHPAAPFTKRTALVLENRPKRGRRK